jgi:hypothetical protein
LERARVFVTGASYDCRRLAFQMIGWGDACVLGGVDFRSEWDGGVWSGLAGSEGRRSGVMRLARDCGLRLFCSARWQSLDLYRCNYAITFYKYVQRFLWGFFFLLKRGKKSEQDYLPGLGYEIVNVKDFFFFLLHGRERNFRSFPMSEECLIGEAGTLHHEGKRIATPTGLEPAHANVRDF